MKKILIISLLGFFIGSNLNAEDLDYAIAFEKSPTMAMLQKKSNKKDKLIFIDCFTTWCGPCKWLAKNVFTDPKVGEFMNENFVSAKIDMEKGEGIEIAKKYGIRAYPTLLFLDSEGNMVHRICGAGDSEKFLEGAKLAMNKSERLGAYVSKYKSGERSNEFLSDYLIKCSQACMNDDEALANYWENQSEEDLISATNWKMYEAFVRDINSEQFTYLLANHKKFAAKNGKENVDKITEYAYQRAFSKAIYAKEDKEKKFNEVKTHIDNTTLLNKNKIIFSAMMNKARAEKNWNMYGNTAVMYVNTYLKENSTQLNSYAWSFYENIDDERMLAEALKWANKSVELNEQYMNMDTKAALLFKLNKKQEGLKAAKRAIELAKENGEDYKGTSELIEKYK